MDAGHGRMRVALGPILALLAGMLVAAPALSASAQDSTQCPLQPISLPLFDATPAAVIVQTPSVSAEVPEPGEDEITLAAEGIIACTNESPQALRYAVFTDRLLAVQFTKDEPAYQPSFERMIANGTAPGEGVNVLEGISDLVSLGDGRVEVTFHITTSEGSVEDRLILAWDPDRQAWLIDGIVDLRDAATPTG